MFNIKFFSAIFLISQFVFASKDVLILERKRCRENPSRDCYDLLRKLDKIISQTQKNQSLEEAEDIFEKYQECETDVYNIRKIARQMAMLRERAAGSQSLLQDSIRGSWLTQMSRVRVSPSASREASVASTLCVEDLSQAPQDSEDENTQVFSGNTEVVDYDENETMTKSYGASF